MRVLVVEDDPLVGDGIRRALSGGAFAADLVSSAEAAKSALDTESFDLVIADIGLPRQNGLQLVRSLRSRGKVIPILILTARDGLEDRVTALDLGQQPGGAVDIEDGLQRGGDDGGGADVGSEGVE